jgi:hypothetical protein
MWKYGGMNGLWEKASWVRFAKRGKKAGFKRREWGEIGVKLGWFWELSWPTEATAANAFHLEFRVRLR